MTTPEETTAPHCQARVRPTIRAFRPSGGLNWAVRLTPLSSALSSDLSSPTHLTPRSAWAVNLLLRADFLWCVSVNNVGLARLRFYRVVPFRSRWLRLSDPGPKWVVDDGSAR